MSSSSNTALLVLVAVLPLCSAYILRHFRDAVTQTAPLAPACQLYVHHPLLIVNSLWLVHVDLTFYVISLCQVCCVPDALGALQVSITVTAFCSGGMCAVPCRVDVRACLSGQHLSH
jgi:hypothetical protein